MFFVCFYKKHSDLDERVLFSTVLYIKNHENDNFTLLHEMALEFKNN
jgi:hypothetical protein